MKIKTKRRCPWVKDGDALYKKYHDTEWGVPVHNDKKMFEFLVLESAQAGLSWITVLRKRENYRKAFAGFDPKRVSQFGKREISVLLKNAGIIRNRAKIEAAINNAIRFLEVQKEFGTFSKYIWQFVGNKQKINKLKKHSDYKPKSKESDALAMDLKKRGFKFLGSTTLYAHMQATGMVNDHVVDCFRYKAVGKRRPTKTAKQSQR
ncbi:MAG: DNA-3-methyladenine glycosylase I [Patescibacteria group bacterium]